MAIKGAPSRNVATVALSPELYQDLGRLARKRGITRSAIIREALVRFRRQEGDWDRLLDRTRQAFGRAGIRSEADVERIVSELRS